MKYIWKHPDWPHFTWDDQCLAAAIRAVIAKRDALYGALDAVSFDVADAIRLETLVCSALDSALIEGEHLNEDAVRSSIANHLGLAVGGLRPDDLKSEGMAEMITDATTRCQEPITKERLCLWQSRLFNRLETNLLQIGLGQWREDREGPMTISSGPMGRQSVHYIAPPAHQVDADMNAFLDWFENPGDTDSIIVAGVAHLWFECIHPFDDGNGRVGRAIADTALARSDDQTLRAYSLTSQIYIERKDYSKSLKAASAQCRTLDCTDWLLWFTGCLERSLDNSMLRLNRVLLKSRFWVTHGHSGLNDRQAKVINRMFSDFDGIMSTARWANIAKCSKDTAFRDLSRLVEIGVLERTGTGRGTKYRFSPAWDVAGQPQDG